MANQAELVITALQQRIGEIVSNYETQIAFLRAELTKVSEEKEAKFEAAEAYSEHLENISTVD
jgi:restriction endonuclease S subunit